MENGMENESRKHAMAHLTTEFNRVVEDAEMLLEATAHLTDKKFSRIRAKVEDSLRVVKDQISDTQASLLGKTKAIAKGTDVYARQNPWQAIGIATGFGVLLGLLISRR
jgi:ElaB/YqjD/DUF883 family membrane-anchored ribosome-binding protein